MFLTQLLNIGLYEDIAPQLKKQILRTNFTNFTTQFLVIVYGLVFYFLDATFHSLLMILVFLLFGAVYWLNKTRHYKLASVWLLVQIAICVFYFGGSFGKNSSVHFLFYAFNIFPFLFFRLSQLHYIVPLILLYAATFGIMHYELIKLPIVLDSEGQGFMHNSILWLTYCWSIANYVFFTTTNKQVEKELKVSNKRLVAKNEQMEDLTYAASHDLQEPVRSILGFTNLLELQYKEKLEGDGKEYLQYISSGASRMSGLIDALMTHGRIGRTKTLSKFDTSKTVLQVTDDLASLIMINEPEITTSDLPIIMGYETDFRALMQNLIANAIKFKIPQTKPKIIISCVDTQHEWLFKVKDNGIGIDEKNHTKIFQIFQRLHVREKYEGTGIGLSHCKKIVELHNGSIWVNSKKGNGASFYFTISKTLE